MTLRAVVAMMEHETNTFSPVPTPLARFGSPDVPTGPEVYRHFKGTGTGIGAFLTGLVSVGIGEVIMPQLVRRNRIPVPVAAATSVFIVIVTVACASFTHVSALIAAGGMNAVPWNLVSWTIPGVIIGGQIGPRLQGKFSQRAMECAIGALFGGIGVTMAWIAYRELVG